MLNKIILQGNLTKDPELRYTAKNTPVCSFTLAVNDDFGREKSCFANCVAWSKSGEFVSQHFHKGDQMLVEGRLDQRSYTDKDGTKRTAYEVIADKIQFCGKRSSEAKEAKLTEISEADGELPF